MSAREVLLLAHIGRQDAIDSAGRVTARLAEAGVGVRVLSTEAAALAVPQARAVVLDRAAEGVELVLVLGGDGSLLRGAELARQCGAPLLGVNLGHVGFLAEAEPEALDTTVERIVAGSYRVEERMTVDVEVVAGGTVLARGWALNEIALEKSNRTRMLDCVLEVDGRPLSRWGCDGVVVATPTGSTAYAFSAGGPVVWPEVEALLVVPISAHALFARPLLTGPDSSLAIEVLPAEAAVLSCDGRRTIPIAPPARVVVRRGAQPVRLARLLERSFTDRLVAKFDLPVEGWRGRAGSS